MRETIILAPGANSNELSLEMARNGIYTINFSVHTGSTLARLALLRAGISIKEKFVDNDEQHAYIARASKGIDYFGRTTYSDIVEITGAIRKIKSLVTGNSQNEAEEIKAVLDKGMFEQKNSALYEVYLSYSNMLKEDNAIDKVDLIKKAIYEAKPIDADFIMLEEYVCSPVEIEMLKMLSGNTCKTMSLSQLFKRSNNKADELKKSKESAKDDSKNDLSDNSQSEDKIHINSIKNCYGMPNEVETIINDIYENKKVDECTVVITDVQSYSQLFFDYALLYNLPVTFGCGIPIINSYAAKLLVRYYHWMTQGFFGPQAVDELLDSTYFNKKSLMKEFPEVPTGFNWKLFYRILGNIRFTNDYDTNRARLQDYTEAASQECELSGDNTKMAFIPFLEVIARELALYPENFIQKYAKVRFDNKTYSEKLLVSVDIAAISAICNTLKVIRLSGVEQAPDDIIKKALSIAVCGQSSQPGMLHIADIRSAHTSIRKNMYFAGLAASKYPGNAVENYLLLDSDLELFGEKADYLKANNRILQKRKVLISLVKMAEQLGSNINVSYSGLNVSELKSDNESSLIYELKRMTDDYTGENPKAVQEITYFLPAISASRKIGDAYNQGNIIKINENSNQENRLAAWKVDREYSPTEIETFFACPRKFLYKSIFEIEEEHGKDPFQVLSAADAGIMAHKLVEKLTDRELRLDAFLNECGQYFDRFIKQNPPLIKDSIAYERGKFLEMMEIAYNLEVDRQVVMTEEKLHVTHSSGVKLVGVPDRVELVKEDQCFIIDFKTGEEIHRIQDDIDSCLQIVLYAYMLEKKGYNVIAGVYRYIRTGETVRCVYNDLIRKALDEKLTMFKENLENGTFERYRGAGASNGTCLACPYHEICW